MTFPPFRLRRDALARPPHRPARWTIESKRVSNLTITHKFSGEIRVAV